MKTRRINYPASRKPSPRISLPVDELITRYQAGESLKALGEAYGCDRSAIKNRLEHAGIEIRGRSAAEREKWKKIKDDRASVIRQCSAAWNSVRGERKRFEHLRWIF